MLDIEPGVARGRGVRGRGPRSLPALKFRLRDLDRQTTPRNIELDDVTGPHQRQRSAKRRFRGDVQDDRAEAGTAHPSIADPDHVGYTSLEQLGRQRDVRHLGHPWIAAGPGAPDDEAVVSLNIDVWIV